MAGKELYFDSRNRRKVGGGGQKTFLPTGVVGRKELESLYNSSVATEDHDFRSGVVIDRFTSWNMGAIAYLQSSGEIDWEELRKRGCDEDTIVFFQKHLEELKADGWMIRKSTRGL